MNKLKNPYILRYEQNELGSGVGLVGLVRQNKVMQIPKVGLQVYSFISVGRENKDRFSSFFHLYYELNLLDLN